MVMQLIFKQQHLIKEHDLFSSLQLINVNSFCCFSHLRMKYRFKANVVIELFKKTMFFKIKRRKLVTKLCFILALIITYLYLHIFSYQSTSVVCGVCPVIRSEHLLGVFRIHSERRNCHQ